MYLQDSTAKEKKQEKDYEIRISPLKEYVPPEWYQGRFMHCGDFLTEITMQNFCETHVKRLDATHYEVVSTGEIREYREMSEDERLRARRSALWRAFEGLTAVLRANFSGTQSNSLFVTLTYAENMQDRARLYEDFKRFMKRLKRAYSDVRFEYVSVVEPQGRGAWHIHLMLKSVSRDVLFIPYEQTHKLWGHGFTDTRRLKSDDVGRYYTAYFTGMIAGAEKDDECLKNGNFVDTSEEIFTREQAIVKAGQLPKKYVKGARISFYPKGMKLYRCSSGIVRPEAFEAVRGQPDPNLKLEFARAFAVERVNLVTGEVETLNRIYKATYRKLADELALPIGTTDELVASPYDWSENCVIQAKQLVLGGSC